MVIRFFFDVKKKSQSGGFWFTNFCVFFHFFQKKVYGWDIFDFGEKMAVSEGTFGATKKRILGCMFEKKSLV